MTYVRVTLLWPAFAWVKSMIRPAPLALFFLAGCTWPATPLPPPAVELVGFDWCTSSQRRQCALVRQGGELLVMSHPSHIGVEGDVWDERGVIVEAFSED